MSNNQDAYKVPATPLVLNPDYKPEAKDAAPVETAKVEAELPTYTVKKGDTLSAIAKEQLGSANRYQEIFKLNQDLLKDADHIMPGQVLKLPLTH